MNEIIAPIIPPMTIQDQLEKWVLGHSIHNPDRDECCPDFSCCDPELRASLETRILFWQAFIKDDNQMVEEFLALFLQIMVAKHAKDFNVNLVHINKESIGIWSRRK